MATKVLVVDGEQDILDLLGDSLVSDGYEVLRANQGMQALHLARRHQPDLIVLDLMLPDMDGFTVCEGLQGHSFTADIPVLMLTAMAGELPRLHGLESGATDYCIKPIRLPELKERVRGLLEGRAARVPVA